MTSADPDPALQQPPQVRRRRRLPRVSAPVAPARPASDADELWVDGSTRAALDLIAEGVTELGGFEIAAISILVHDALEVVAVSGSDHARRALEGSRTAVGLTQELVGLADDWGALRFVPHERASDYLSRHGWTPDYEALDVAEAWDPQDMLFAPFLTPDGKIYGLLAVDLPTDGLRPGPAKRSQLEKYALHAGRAVEVALERARLAAHVQLTSQARQAVREAARDLSLEGLLMQCHDDLVVGFRALGMWIHTIEGGENDAGVSYGHGAALADELPSELAAIARDAAISAWAAKRAFIVSAHRVENITLSDTELDLILDVAAQLGVGSILVVPLGEGRTCLGFMAVTRRDGDPDWTDNDISVALDVGSDLGHAIAHARAFEREQALVRELKALDTYKSELIATLSHELKTPLASILGNLELILETEEVTADGRRGIAAIERGTQRLSRVVNDLMLLAKIRDPGNPLKTYPVDVAALVDDVMTMTAATVHRRSLEVSVDVPDRPVYAAGDPGELDWVVTNVISNATKYTDVGGRIEIRVERRGDDVVLTCADDGIGISADDQGRLFNEFFRSTNPLALGIPGTGLGLAITERIVSRHGGQIGVDSVLGSGTTFEVVLPAADADDGPLG